MSCTHHVCQAVVCDGEGMLTGLGGPVVGSDQLTVAEIGRSPPLFNISAVLFPESFLEYSCLINKRFVHNSHLTDIQ